MGFQLADARPKPGVVLAFVCDRAIRHAPRKDTQSIDRMLVPREVAK
jgi:hypothetical protein